MWRPRVAARGTPGTGRSAAANGADPPGGAGLVASLAPVWLQWKYGRLMSDPIAGETRTILVEFDQLTDEQQMLIDLHSQRALAAELPPAMAGVCVVGFWIRDGETAQHVYDDVQDWANRHALPIRRMVEAPAEP